MNGTSTRIYVFFQKSSRNSYLVLYAFPGEAQYWAADKWLQKEHQSIHKTHWLDAHCPADSNCYQLLHLLCCVSATWPTSVASEGTSVLVSASCIHLLLFNGGLAIWRKQLSKTVFLQNDIALKIPTVFHSCFKLHFQYCPWCTQFFYQAWRNLCSDLFHRAS